jgi:hypothetical protein
MPSACRRASNVCGTAPPRMLFQGGGSEDGPMPSISSRSLAYHWSRRSCVLRPAAAWIVNVHTVSISFPFLSLLLFNLFQLG